MIRKVVILILIIILLLLSFIIYKKANKYKLPKQYKIEIEKLINDEAPKTKICIDEYFQKAQNEYLKIKNIKNTEYVEESVFLIEDCQRGIEVCELNLISKLIDKTENYTNIKDKIPPTDFIGTLNNYIYPYFDRNNINYKELIKIREYSTNKFNEIDNYSYKSLSENNIYKPSD